MLTPAQQQVLQFYASRGVLKVNELCLYPMDAPAFLDDLTRVGIRPVGFDLWRFLDPDRRPDRIVYLLGAGYGLSDDLIRQTDNREATSAILRQRLVEHLPPDADLVCFLFLDGEVYDFFGASSAGRITE